MSDDEDSLFGSPPPSPHAGRPASPSLALPRSSSSGSRPSTSTAPLTQNVGTIALPGSHPDSELPMNPLALSLNHGIVQWPPAHTQPHAAASPYVPYTPSSSSAPSASSTRASTPRPAPPKKATKKRRKESSPPPKPTGPEFVLPDPSEPPPTHFLRNQENLLGRAGRVAGVKPAAITHTRGTSSSNPILIEDNEPDTPIIGRRARERTREKSSQPYIDPALLTAPTNQEIVQVLIGQKDIFPILEGVLKLVMRSTPGGSNTRPTPQPTPTLPVRTGFERRHPAAPPLPTYNYPTKKRKLNRVPAGAADWDVPYPFEAGDGPESYHNTWERERGKRLISELIKLIKNAARKAATKKYLQEQEAHRREQEPSPFGDTSTFPPWLQSSKQPSTTVLQDASNSVTSHAPDPTPSTSTSANTTTTSSTTSTPTPETSDTAFNQLMASLSSAIPDAQQTSVNPLYVSQQQDKTDGISGVDQPIFDTWMSFLETLPMSFNGTPSTSATSASGDQSSQCSTPGVSDFDFGSMQMSGLDASIGNLSFAQASEDYDAMIASIFNAPPGPAAAVADTTPTSSSTSGPVIASPPPFDDSLIDPSLMDLSMSIPSSSSTFPISLTTTMATAAGTDSDFSAMMGLNARGLDGGFAVSQLQNHTQVQAQAPSPGASTSSIGNNDPSTPASAVWDLSTPDVFIGGSGGGGVHGEHGGSEGGFSTGDLAGMWRSTMWDYNTGIAHHGATTDWIGSNGATAEFATADFDFGETVQAPRIDKGKQRAVECESLMASMTPTPGSGITPASSSSATGASSSSSTTISSSTPMPLRQIPIPPTESIISTLLQTPAGTPGLSAALSGTSLFVPKAVAPARHLQLRKDDVVKRAQERRRQLKEELDAVKTRLWETTIEQAGIMTLMHRLDETQARKAS
ncbi:hypothetical protein D9619_004501 [Psilocybe cf. subviscida]|uniref:Uncharacterized protein n=1 Tax=Psilocybe cf. subviscida TaxID=2480587 RepID=A0A8H5F803_9AGAR|nr:hypothetical protein D9619_004501 [Psilocybe cf. subviscida]